MDDEPLMTEYERLMLEATSRQTMLLGVLTLLAMEKLDADKADADEIAAMVNEVQQKIQAALA